MPHLARITLINRDHDEAGPPHVGKLRFTSAAYASPTGSANSRT